MARRRVTLAPGGFIPSAASCRRRVADLRAGHVGADGAARGGVWTGCDLLADADRRVRPGVVGVCDRAAAGRRHGRRDRGDPHRHESDRALPGGAADERHPDGGAVVVGARDRRRAAFVSGLLIGAGDPGPAESCAPGDRAGGDSVHPTAARANSSRPVRDDRGNAAGRGDPAVAESRALRQRARIWLRRCREAVRAREHQPEPHEFLDARSSQTQHVVPLLRPRWRRSSFTGSSAGSCAAARSSRPRCCAIYLLYQPFPEWWYLRFLIPAIVVLLILASAVEVDLLSRRAWAA